MKNKKNSTARNNHFNEKGISYDKNGNILALQRRNSNTLIDNLTYTYQGNQLTKVTDAAANVMGFADGANLTTEYTYDPVGNMISDKNKKVTVTYNHLNLPDQVLKENGDYVRFTYDAAGVKRKSETKTGTVISTRDYVGNFVFANGQLEHIIHPEGRVAYEAGNYRYEFFVKDHLGNIRQVLQGPQSSTVIARIATMEPENAEEERKYFTNLDESRQGAGEHNVTPGGYATAWLNADRGRILGPASTQEVAKGDSVEIQVFGKYVDAKKIRLLPASLLPTTDINNVAQQLAELGQQAKAAAGSQLMVANVIALLLSDLEEKRAPEAFMGYALYDADSNLYEKGKIILSKKARNEHEELKTRIFVPQDGFMRTFLVNETSENVWFDQFRIQNTTPIILQETHGACPESVAIREALGSGAAGTGISAGRDQGE